jgi:hypothetical protein
VVLDLAHWQLLGAGHILRDNTHICLLGNDGQHCVTLAGDLQFVHICSIAVFATAVQSPRLESLALYEAMYVLGSIDTIDKDAIGSLIQN